MASRRFLIGTALSAPVLLLLQAAALAQGTATTGTGGSPLSTQTAPNTTAVGQTKPPGGSASAATQRPPEERTGQQKEDDKITKGICIGCTPK